VSNAKHIRALCFPDIPKLSALPAPNSPSAPSTQGFPQTLTHNFKQMACPLCLCRGNLVTPYECTHQFCLTCTTNCLMRGSCLPVCGMCSAPLTKQWSWGKRWDDVVRDAAGMPDYWDEPDFHMTWGRSGVSVSEHNTIGYLRGIMYQRYAQHWFITPRGDQFVRYIRALHYSAADRMKELREQDDPFPGTDTFADFLDEFSDWDIPAMDDRTVMAVYMITVQCYTDDRDTEEGIAGTQRVWNAVDCAVPLAWFDHFINN